MMMMQIFSIFISAMLAVNGALAASHFFERIHMHPRHFTQLRDPVPPTERIELSIHLPQQNEAIFEKRLMEISTPDHPSYGKYMSQSEIDKILSPKSTSTAAVKRWLDRNDCGKTARVTKDAIKVDLTIRQAEKLLGTKYSYFSDDKSGERILRTKQYSLPRGLHEHVAFVQPTTAFPFRSQGHMFGSKSSLRKRQEVVFRLGPKVDIDGEVQPLGIWKRAGFFNTTLDPSCNKTITPSCLASLYGFADYKAIPNTIIGVAGYLGEHAKYNDLAQFLSTYAPKKSGPQSLLGSVNINGANNSQIIEPENSGEANLDVQYTVSLTSPIHNVYYSTAGEPPFIPDADTLTNTNEPYLEFLEYMIRLPQSKLPSVISTSYGDTEQSVPRSYAQKVCNLMGQLGARGVSMLFASGDEGPGVSCISNDGKNSTKFIPEFPTSCPWITSVGGTCRILPERAIGFSSGGFSEYFPRPAYQRPQIDAFLRNNPDAWKQFAKYFNKGGRAYPDVSAQSNNFLTIINGTLYPAAGTSASTPVFASVVALLNSERICRGKKPLGFLNPWLYGESVRKNNGLTDITVGSSEGCNGKQWDEPLVNGTFRVIPNAGWKAVKGWDASTGLGTPNFPGLKKSL